MLHGLEVLDRRRTVPLGDHGLTVRVVSWVLVVATIFTLLTRLALKLALSRKPRRLGLDDVCIIIAALFSVGQTISVSIEAVHVLGQHSQTVTPSQMKIFQKAEYVSCMFYIANLGFARTSVCLLIRKILPGRVQQCTALCFAIFSLLWCISGVLVTAFPCHLPRPWDFSLNKCIDLKSFVNYVAVSNIIMETILISLPLCVWNLRLQNTGRTLSVSMVFIARLGIVICVLCQLVIFNHSLSYYDLTYSYWLPTLFLQIAQNLSIITACLPYFHPFILSLLSGATKPDDLVFNHRFKSANRFLRHFSEKGRPSGGDEERKSFVPIRETAYVAPLATYGLDSSFSSQSPCSSESCDSSSHQHNSHTHPAPIYRSPSSSSNVFNRMVEIPPPRSRPVSYTPSQRSLPPLPPKALGQVGVLPVIDWDTDSSSERSSPTRRHRGDEEEYVFRREKVISVPEDKALFEHGHSEPYKELSDT